jgi:hypothetical protein
VPVADLQAIAIYFGEAIDCLIRLYDGLFNDTEYISAIFGLLNTDGRILVNAAGAMPLWNQYTCRIPQITIERRMPLAEWRSAVLDHAVQMAEEVYHRFNWPNPSLGLAKSAIERTFARRL